LNASNRFYTYGKGKVVAGNNINIKTKYLYGNGAEFTALNSIKSKAYYMDLVGSRLKANGRLTLTATNIKSDRARLNANTIDINAKTLSNYRGLYSAKSLIDIETDKLKSLGTLKSQKDIRIKLKRDNLILKARERLYANRNLILDIRGDIVNNRFATLGARNILQAKARNIRNYGTISSGRNMQLTTTNLTNSNGKIISGRNLSIYVSGTLKNIGRSSLLQARDNLVIAGNSRGGLTRLVQNIDGKIVAQRGSVFIDSNRLENTTAKRVRTYTNLSWLRSKTTDVSRDIRLLNKIKSQMLRRNETVHTYRSVKKDGMK